MIFCFMMLVIQQQYQLNSNPSDSHSVQLENYLTLYDSDDYIFYKATLSTISANNSIFVYSNGSDQLYKFAADGNLISKRKVKGSGPGEISTPIMNIFTIENRLIVQEVFKLHIYDDNLKLITDVRLMLKGQVGQSIQRDNDILVVYPTLNNAFQLYDKNGTLLKSSIPEKYEILNAYGFNRGDSFHFYNNHYIKRSKGKYTINIYAENFNQTTSLVKDFTRILNPNPLIPIKKLKGTQFITGEGDEFLSDISSITGTYKNLIFLNVAAEDDKWKFHVIKDEHLFVSEIILDITDVAYHLTICGDKLIMDLYNPDDGNYVKIYKIRTTEN